MRNFVFTLLVGLIVTHGQAQVYYIGTEMSLSTIDEFSDQARSRGYTFENEEPIREDATGVKVYSKDTEYSGYFRIRRAYHNESGVVYVSETLYPNYVTKMNHQTMNASFNKTVKYFERMLKKKYRRGLIAEKNYERRLGNDIILAERIYNVSANNRYILRFLKSVEQDKVTTQGGDVYYKHDFSVVKIRERRYGEDNAFPTDKFDDNKSKTKEEDLNEFFESVFGLDISHTDFFDLNIYVKAFKYRYDLLLGKVHENISNNLEKGEVLEHNIERSLRSLETITQRLSQVNNAKVKTIFRSLDGDKIAQAKGSIETGDLQILVDPISFKNASQPKRFYILFHELGHNILGLDHGEGGKMMFNYTEKDYTYNQVSKDLLKMQGFEMKRLLNID